MSLLLLRLLLASLCGAAARRAPTTLREESTLRDLSDSELYGYCHARQARRVAGSANITSSDFIGVD